jgi:EndoU nuclease-like protein
VTAEHAPAGPPSSTGSAGPDVPDVLAEFYPGGDPALLRAAASAWSALADGMDRIAYAGDAAFRAVITTGEGAAFSAMRTFWAQRFTPCAVDPLLNAVVNGAGLLGRSCTALADLIERTRSAIRGAVAEAASDMAPLDLPAKLLAEVTWGATELELLVGTGALAVSYFNDYRDAYRTALDRLVEQLRPEDEQRLRRVSMPPAPDAPVGVGLRDVGQITGLALTGTMWDTLAGEHPTPDSIHITPQRTTHILDGDEYGGGHAPGTGKPGKNEFPDGWARDKIIATALSVARDPDTVPERQPDDRWRIDVVREGIRIRVIVDTDGSLVTAIPMGGRGVVQNPRR